MSRRTLMLVCFMLVLHFSCEAAPLYTPGSENIRQELSNEVPMTLIEKPQTEHDPEENIYNSKITFQTLRPIKRSLDENNKEEDMSTLPPRSYVKLADVPLRLPNSNLENNADIEKFVNNATKFSTPTSLILNDFQNSKIVTKSTVSALKDLHSNNFTLESSTLNSLTTDLANSDPKNSQIFTFAISQITEKTTHTTSQITENLLKSTTIAHIPEKINYIYTPPQTTSLLNTEPNSSHTPLQTTPYVIKQSNSTHESSKITSNETTQLNSTHKPPLTTLNVTTQPNSTQKPPRITSKGTTKTNSTHKPHLTTLHATVQVNSTHKPPRITSKVTTKPNPTHKPPLTTSHATVQVNSTHKPPRTTHQKRRKSTTPLPDPTTPPPSCFPTSNMADRSSCRHYFRCSHFGKPFRFECGYGQLFDDVSTKCRRLVSCGHRPR